MAATDLVVVVVTFNSAEVIGDLLRAIPDAGDDTIAIRTVVVDNNSADGTAEAVAAFPGVELVETGSNRGYAAGINRGVAHAQTFDALLVVNPDVGLTKECLRPLLDALQPPVGIAVPKTVGPAGELWKTIRRDPSILRAFGELFLTGRVAGRWDLLGEMDRRSEHYLEPRDVDWASGHALLISRRCWDQVGRWDESFFLYSEEVDYATRAREAGFSVRLVPASVVTHVGGESFVSPMLRSLQAVNRVRFYRRRHGALATSVFYVAVLLNEARRFRSAACRASTKALLSRRFRPGVIGNASLLRREGG